MLKGKDGRIYRRNIDDAWTLNKLKGHVPASVVIAALVIAILVPKIDF